MNKEVKKKFFKPLADWFIYTEPNYPSFEEYISWNKKQNFLYGITKNYKREILILLTYLTMSQKINNVLYPEYFDQILFK